MISVYIENKCSTCFIHIGVSACHKNICKYLTCCVFVFVFASYEICAMFIHRLKIKCAFFYVCANIIYFGGFSVFCMAGIENTSNYCFLSSLLHCVLNCNDIRNFLFDHYKCNAGLIAHNSTFFIL